MDFIAVLPFVVPPVTLAVGILQLFSATQHHLRTAVLADALSGPQILGASSYVILALPFTYRSLDAGMHAIDLHTLTEAAQSLGAGWHTSSERDAAQHPLRPALGGVPHRDAGDRRVHHRHVSLVQHLRRISIRSARRTANGAAALAVISLLLTWAAMLGILFLGRGSRRQQGQIGGAR